MKTKPIYINVDKIPRKVLYLIIAVVAFTIFSTIVCIVKAQTEQKIVCALFDTQAEAQNKFNTDPKRYAKLDGYDKDGKVCEGLPK